MNHAVPTQSKLPSSFDSIERSYRRYILPVALFTIFAMHLVSPSKNSQQTTFYLTLLLPGLFLFAKYYKDQPRNKILIPVTLFLIYSAITAFWSDPYTLNGAWQAAKNSLYVFIFIYCLTFLDHQKQTIPILKLLILTAAAASLYSLYDAFIINGTPFGKRMLGTGNLDHPLRTSTVFGFFAICNCFILMPEKNSHRSIKLLFSVTLVCLLSGLICGISRTPLAATTVCLLALCFTSRNKAALILLVVAVIALLVTVIGYPDIISKFTARGMSLRPIIWADALEHIKQAPIIGHGIRSEISITGRNIDSAHSRYLSTLYYSGAIGLLLFLSALVMAFLRNLNKNPDYLNLFKIMLLYGLMCSVTEGKFLISRPDMVWLIIWFPLGLVLSEQLQRQKLPALAERM
ncbi:MAG: hypothetical protein COB51_01650 [Moraxellaceae bacterium]|nr:MAG: hypothetical protein COB51_01650 [Moraxellaceae bacterium]